MAGVSGWQAERGGGEIMKQINDLLCWFKSITGVGITTDGITTRYADILVVSGYVISQAQ